MSGLGKRGPGGFTLGTLQGVHGNERIYLPDMFQQPEESWSVTTGCDIVTDDYSATNIATEFVNSSETGVGFSLKIPNDVTKIYLRLPGRCANGDEVPGKVVVRLSARPNGGSWTGPIALGILDLPNNLSQSWSHTALLSTLSVSAGDVAQFVLSRNPLSASDTLSAPWLLYELGVNFS